MKAIVACAAGCMVFFGACASAMADNQWGNYRGVDTLKQHRPQPPVNRPMHPSQRPIYPHHPHYPNRPYPPYPNHPYPPMPQSGVSIHYQAPTTVIQNSQSYSWVNGDPNVAYIESSTQAVITDWRRIGLPAPPSGMYWIFENGRYVLVPNR
ncbi:RcnB family protein [Acinetobacter sp.]|jgi:Ni/Co efflux regulator RcnB|uniref:RcnB family protein n=1 Tax=Acinetobacter sp. TaxID=472 RepID=UPI0035B46C3C